jgi:hypothetical protein
MLARAQNSFVERMPRWVGVVKCVALVCKMWFLVVPKTGFKKLLNYG